MTRIVLAVPTIPERAHRLPDLERLWRERTPEADLDIIYSEAGSSWASGLNDVWRRTKDDPPDVWIAGSDDFVPGDHRWLPNLLPWLEKGCYPAPKVEDPRFVNYGGHPQPVPDGTPSDMSSFPILRGDWLDKVFPLPDDLHYYADNLLAARVWKSGVERCVAVPSCRIIHLHAPEGRGAGYGSENTRLYIDTVRYTRALEADGIDRESLPKGMRGAMYEAHFQEIGTLAGA